MLICLWKAPTFLIPPFRYRWIGSKSVLSNISDVVAMGGCPRYVTVSLGVDPETEVKDLDDFFSAFIEQCERYNCLLVGGDLCKSEKFVVSVSVLGEVNPDCVLTRSGAKPRDLVCVTGFPGTSAVGLEAILENYPETLFSYFIDRHVRPNIRKEFAVKVAEKKIASAMIDISDGLIMDAYRLSNESRVVVEINLEKLPIFPCTNKQLKYLKYPVEHYILHGGEEYELLFTVPERALNLVLEIAEATATPVHVIGVTSEGIGVYLLSEGKKEQAVFKGFSHFGGSS